MPSQFFRNLPKEEQDKLKNQVLHVVKSEEYSISDEDITKWAEQNSIQSNLQNK